MQASTLRAHLRFVPILSRTCIYLREIELNELINYDVLDLGPHLLFSLSSVGPLKVTLGAAFVPPRERVLKEAPAFFPLPSPGKLLRIAAIGSGRR